MQWGYYKTMRSIKSFMFVGLLSILTLTMMCGVMLASSTVLADDDAVVDEVSVTVPVACSMTGTGMNTHSAEIHNGLYVPNIGTTTIQAFCNDANGFAIYAAGYTGDEIGGLNSNKLVGTSTSGNAVIETGLATAPGNPDVSNWAMKIATVQDSGDTTGDKAFVIDSAPNTAGGADASFASYHVVPNEYTKVAHKNAGTDMTAGTGGVKLTTTYAAYISQTQMADTYSGKVKYTLVHPSMAVAGRLNVTYNGNGLTFAGDKATNLVAYDAIETATTGAVTKKSYTGSYNSEGGFNGSGYGAPAGNEVVTIDGASTIHIAVTWGAPQNYGGPPSDLAIWVGNHPGYTNDDLSTALTSCGGVNATNGAFSSNGSGGTQVTMECDITGDSVTFYDYSTNTNNNYSMGYYAVITGQGDITTYSKTVDSGAYVAPTGRSGQDVFLGWSTNPNANAEAEEPLYADGADFANNAPYTNEDVQVTLYAVWGKTFNAAYADAGKTQVSGHYKMQDVTDELCKEIYVGATETLVDSRDSSTYMVGRLKDGKCWMVENLNLAGGSALSAENTDVDATYINSFTTSNNLTKDGNTIKLPASATTGFNQYNYSYVYNSGKTTDCGASGQNTPCYSYYSWDAATLGSGRTLNTENTDAPYSICPKGWRLPTSGNSSNNEWKRGDFYALATAYGANLESNYHENSATFYNNAGPGTTPNFLLAGRYDDGSFITGGSYGNYWSSTSYSNTSYVRSLYFSSSSVYSADIVGRYRGFSVRCLFSGQ